jgi:polyphosphate kinase
MSRNLKHRIEVVVPVSDPVLKNYLKNVLLAAYLRDNVKARELQPDGSYQVVPRVEGENPFASQTFFIHHEVAVANGIQA